MEDSPKGFFSRHFTFSNIIASVALIVSFLVAYQNSLKSFDPSIRLAPEVGIQHSGNLGLYVTVDIDNRSPRSGLIQDFRIVLWNKQASDDKYLLSFRSFRVLNPDDISWSDSKERMPLLIEPWQRVSKVLAFVYGSEDEFPISMGTYDCELYYWSDYQDQPLKSAPFSFALTKDVLDGYVASRNSKSTSIMFQNIVGHTPLTSKKLTKDEYKALQ